MVGVDVGAAVAVGAGFGVAVGAGAGVTLSVPAEDFGDDIAAGEVSFCGDGELAGVGDFAAFSGVEVGVADFGAFDSAGGGDLWAVDGEDFDFGVGVGLGAGVFALRSTPR